MNGPPRVLVKQTLADLLPRFLENRRADVVQARESLAQIDFANVRRIAHRLKGSGSGYGFHAVSAFGADLEQACLRADGAEVLRLIDALDEYLGQVQIDIV